MKCAQLISKAFIESHPEYGNIEDLYEKYEISSVDLNTGIIWFNVIYKPFFGITQQIQLASS